MVGSVRDSPLQATFPSVTGSCECPLLLYTGAIVYKKIVEDTDSLIVAQDRARELWRVAYAGRCLAAAGTLVVCAREDLTG